MKLLRYLWVVPVVLWGMVIPAQAQSSGTVTVTFSITDFIVNDLQEDAPWADQVDETYVIYGLQELTPAGSPVAGHSIVTTWPYAGAMSLRLYDHLYASSFAPLTLDIAAGNKVQVAFAIYETEGELATYIEGFETACNWGGAEVVGLLAPQYAIGADIACFAAQFFGEDTQFLQKTPLTPLIYSSAEMSSGVNQTVLFQWTSGVNWGEYEIHYTLKAGGTVPPAASSGSSGGSGTSGGMIAVTLPGDFGDEIGCGSDWDPACQLTRMSSLSGGVYTFQTRQIPKGTWEVKVALNGTWDENYGANGVSYGENIRFVVPADNRLITFTWNSSTKRLDYEIAGSSGTSASVVLADMVTARDEFSGTFTWETHWWLYNRKPQLADGHALLQGKNEWDLGIGFTTPIDAGEGVLFSFKYQPGTMGIMLSRNDWDSPQYQRWLFQAGNNDWEMSTLKGAQGNESQTYSRVTLKPGQWYYLVFRVNGDGSFDTWVWEHGNPSSYKLQYHGEPYSGQWTGSGWGFLCDVYNGSIETDFFWKLDFPAGFMMPDVPPRME